VVFRAGEIVARAIVLYQGTTSPAAEQAAEKLAFEIGSYQGMTLVMQQSVDNKRGALQAAEECRLRDVLKGHGFSRADKPFIFGSPRGL